MRTCYRSTWRLHENPAILTRGRYYRAAADAPVVPSATYLVSREWTQNKLELPHGEWGGSQFYDDGTPPHLLPVPGVIGGDCLENLRPSPGDDDAAGANRGRCVHLPTQEICGNVPLFADFSLAYDTGIITYYRNVGNYLTVDEPTGEWSGTIPGIDNAKTRVTVSEGGGGQLQWLFALCDNGAEMVFISCCSNPWPKVFTRDVIVRGVSFINVIYWEETFEDTVFTWQALNTWTATLTRGGSSYLMSVTIWCPGVLPFNIMNLHDIATSEVIYEKFFEYVTCDPPHFEDANDYNGFQPTAITFCGHTVGGAGEPSWVQIRYGPMTY